MKLFLALIYVFLPPIITQVFYPESVLIPGTHTHLSELGVFSLMVYWILKKKTVDLKSAYLLSLAFLLVFFADFIYTYKFNFALDIPLAISRFSSLCYSGFMITVSVYLFSAFKGFLKDRISLVLFALSFGVFSYLNFEYVLSAIYSKNVGSSFSLYLNSAVYFYYINTTVYALFVSLNISLLLPLVIRTRRLFENLFCSALLLVPIADFAIRFEEISRAKSSFPTPFEHGWEIGIVSVFMLLLYKRKLPEFTEDTVVSYFSIRVILVASILVFSTLLISALFALNLVIIKDAFNLSNVLFMLYLIIFLSNLVSIRISSHVSSLGDYLETLLSAKQKGESPALGSRLEVLKKTANIHEVDNILRKYNDLTNHANRLHEIALKNSKLAAIGETTRLVAHDVRKPFALIKSVLSGFEHFKSNPSDLEMAKKDIQEALAQVEAMIGDMMDFSREVKLQTSPESLSQLVHETVMMLKPEHDGSAIQFHYDFPDGDKALIDRQRLKRAIGNIVQNAIEAITVTGRKDSGNIYFRTEGKDGWVELGIGNDGPGLSEEDLPRIFDSVFTKGKRGGTGLGLASVKKIVELHDGTILARNRAGGGVEFLLRLPAPALSPESAGAAPRQNARDEAGPGPAPDKDRVVLACDDDPLARRCTGISLETALKGAEVHVFGSGEELLAKFRELLSSGRKAEYVIFTDQNMGGMSGLELVRAVRAEAASCRVFMVSNEFRSEMEKKALDAGADAYYEGPLDAELLARINL